MTEWRIEPTDSYERAHKHYEKKQPQELKAVLDNLDRYFKAVAQGVHPQFVVAGYIHDEGKVSEPLISGAARRESSGRRGYMFIPMLTQNFFTL